MAKRIERSTRFGVELYSSAIRGYSFFVTSLISWFFHTQSKIAFRK